MLYSQNRTRILFRSLWLCWSLVKPLKMTPRIPFNRHTCFAMIFMDPWVSHRLCFGVTRNGTIIGKPMRARSEDQNMCEEKLLQKQQQQQQLYTNNVLGGGGRDAGAPAPPTPPQIFCRSASPIIVDLITMLLMLLSAY